MTVTSLMIVS